MERSLEYEERFFEIFVESKFYQPAECYQMKLSHNERKERKNVRPTKISRIEARVWIN